MEVTGDKAATCKRNNVLITFISYLNKNFSYLDKATIFLSTILIVLSFLFSYINCKYTHYLSSVTPPLLIGSILIILAIMLTLLALPLRQALPKISLVFKLIGLYLIAWVAMLLAYNMQFTPFDPLDDYLYHIDLALGFDLGLWMQWLHQHPYIQQSLLYIYDSLEYQAFVLPIIACFLVDQQDIELFLAKFAFLNLIGCLIYYFLPTASPASVVASPYFTQGQLDIVLQFKQLHEGIQPSVIGAGLISFPSFHVIWSALFTCLFKKQRYLFWPLLTLNVILWFSTVLLGWHYILDVLAGLILVLLAIIIFDYEILKRSPLH
ncbi:phosphatidic acid phosphatase [Piscirickettsia salmonis]|uniref:PAP2 superfamily protein n=1 Tax=Piscirickettsia salmonis TaxID=1238 RepID=A0A9Q5VGJ3_PISSA|nr:phosphatase PAP2 family protein [Piscirickettsia salmonis]ALA25288.1 PAP2 superfamily protein [Piscirickettsia salmonis]APS45525.1 phosphatidic acid phosphatase [Piscirickettsia salmonis]APS46182.1 phosphatidic acid phosphatase [Piscirickettsia salmonis]APS50113.1 phosphatidic acid phosphatase [Piscirickettsia salmonis]APS53313.1 phosphatidic acid phosphatase [Piscirickettsia salmonis]